MKKEMIKNVETVAIVAVDGLGVCGCLNTIKKVHQQAAPQIKEATGKKKVWFIAVTVFTELAYLGFAIGSIAGAIASIHERIIDHNNGKIIDNLNDLSGTHGAEESEEEKDFSEDSEKIKSYMDTWSSIANDDQRVYDK